MEKFNPEISVRTSMADYKKEEWLVNLPSLYVVEEICSQGELIQFNDRRGTFGDKSIIGGEA